MIKTYLLYRDMAVYTRVATFADHDAICDIMKTSPFTRSFSSIMFSNDEAYNKGWIRVIVSEGGQILGASCVRHKVREPRTILYFLAIEPTLRSSGVGALLMQDLEQETPWRRVHLDVNKKNPRAKTFYERLGYKVTGERTMKNGDDVWDLEKAL